MAIGGLLVERVNGGNAEGYSDSYFKLMADITVEETIATGTPTMMVGANTSDNTKFRGTFDGNGHTITLAYNDTRNAEFCAPFLYVKDATIKHLRVAGTVRKTQNIGAAGIVGRAEGTSYISSCRVSADIQFERSGNVSSGGIVADLNHGIIYITNCLFDGKMQGGSSTGWGGLVGWVDSDSEAHFANCLFNPELASVGSSDKMPFARRSEAKDLYFTHIYRMNDNLGTGQAVDASGYDNAQLLAALGTAWETVTESSIEKVTPIIYPRPFTGDGTSENPYEIATAAQWDQIAANVNSGVTTYSGKHFKQTADFTVEESIDSGTPTTMIGCSETKSFQGTYDGNGHTITLNYTDNRTEDFCAPFRYINGASIFGLGVAGTITKMHNKYAAGLVGRAYGTNYITNCRVSAHILSSTSGNGSHGGFVGELQGSGSYTYIENCLFDGKLKGSSTSNWGGFVGWVDDGCTANFRYSMFNPALLDVNESGCGTFYNKHEEGGHVSFTTSYYTKVLKNAQGTQAYAINPGENVSVTFCGTGTDNIPSTVTAYYDYDSYEVPIRYPGLKVGDVLYAGQNEQVKLTLEYTAELPPYYSGADFTVTGGTLTKTTPPSGGQGAYTLTMPASDVTVNAVLVPSGWEGSGTEDEPYLVRSDAHWRLLVSQVNSGNSNGFSGKFFKLMDDITLEETIYDDTPTMMVGANTNDNTKFRGTFDGNGHTITLNYYDGRNAELCAPFLYVKDATIKYLRVMEPSIRRRTSMPPVLWARHKAPVTSPSAT